MTILTELTEPASTGFTAATDQPYTYVRKELSEPDWRRYPGWATVTESEWRDAQWQRAHSVKNIRAAARGDRGPARRAVLRRPGRRSAAARHHVDAAAAADAEHHGSQLRAGTPQVHRGLLCRSDPALHAAGAQ